VADLGGGKVGTMADTQPLVKCRWPFNHISIDVYGNVRPCCAWELHDTDISYNINTQPLHGYFASDMYQQLITAMQKNQYGLGCRDCHLEEINHMPEGTREVGFSKYTNQQSFEIFDMEIKFGNLCNQGCVMCSPMNSSVIAEERLRHNIRTDSVTWHHEQEVKSGILHTPWYLNDDRLAEVAELAAQCRGQVKFRGGEPTVNNHLQNFLARLSDINTDLNIFINTNGLTFTKKLQQQLMKFDRVHLEVSIDGYGAVNDYVRWPSNWTKLNDNVDHMIAMPNTKLTVSTTVHTLNVGHMQPLCEWVATKNIDSMVANVVWGPEYLRPCLADPQHIQNYIDTAQHFNTDQFDIAKVIPTFSTNWSQQEMTEYRQKLLLYLDQIDKARGIKWQDHVSF